MSELEDSDVWQDKTGRAWVSLASSQDADELEALERGVAEMLWGSLVWAEFMGRFCDDVRIVRCHDHVLYIASTRWAELSPELRENVHGFVRGFVGAWESRP